MSAKIIEVIEVGLYDGKKDYYDKHGVAIVTLRERELAAELCRYENIATSRWDKLIKLRDKYRIPQQEIE